MSSTVTINEFCKFNANKYDFKEYASLISKRDKLQKKLLRINNKKERLEDKASLFSEQDDQYKKCIDELIKLNLKYKDIIDELNAVEIKILSYGYR